MSEGKPLRLFFSWQADAPTSVCRNFIETALKQALSKVAASIEVESAVREVGIEVDRDTLDTAGWAPIVDTIFRKIDDAAIFVPDLTFVATRLDGKRQTANPNVLVECGWALKSLKHERILPVMNVHYGLPGGEAMPFNMRHLRHPIQYDLDDSANTETRRAARDRLAADMAQALRPMLALDAVKALLPQPPTLEPFRAAESHAGLSRFRAPDVPIGFNDGVANALPVTLTSGPVMWLKLMPLHHSGVTHPATELRTLIQRQTILPFGGAGGYGCLRSENGFGVYAIEAPPKADKIETLAIVFIFESGEIWSMNSRIIQFMKEVPYFPADFIRQLDALASFLRDQLQTQRPYRWIAGIEGIMGRPLMAGQTITGFATGHCVTDLVVEEGLYSEGESGAAALRPFFTKILEKCGVDATKIGRLLPTA